MVEFLIVRNGYTLFNKKYPSNLNKFGAFSFLNTAFANQRDNSLFKKFALFFICYGNYECKSSLKTRKK